MLRVLPMLLVLPLAAACDKAAPAPGPETLPNGEPARVTVQHVLIAFAGAERSKATRSPEEARAVAERILNNARNGFPMAELMRESDDAGSGTYTLANAGVSPKTGEMARGSLAKAFADVSFRLGVGEVGFTEYDKDRSPFGYHIIKRIK